MDAEWPYEVEGMPLRIYSLGKDFTIIKTVNVKTTTEAKALVAQHLEGSGYTNLRVKDDGEYSIRFIADPSQGRKGRNVAALDY